MSGLRITHGTWILVSDGRKALFIRQDGDHDLPNFSIQHVLQDDDNPRTAEQGTDRPGLASPAGGAGGATMEQTDWHDLAEKAFARSALAAMDRLSQEIAVDRLVVVAPPRTLAVLRADMPARLRGCLVGEIAKDYAHHPLPEIERLLTRE